MPGREPLPGRELMTDEELNREMNDTAGSRQLTFSYNRFADLYYYLLAHMPINCAADVSEYLFHVPALNKEEGAPFFRELRSSSSLITAA